MSRAAVQACSDLTAQVINPILQSVIDTFDSMLDCQAKRSQVELVPSPSLLMDISSEIGISGKLKGNVCFSFSDETAIGVAERLSSKTHNKISPDVVDAIGELANVIAGSAKCKLNMALNIGLPNVIHDIHYKVRFPVASRPIRVHFESNIGPFMVDFGFVECPSLLGAGI